MKAIKDYVDFSEDLELIVEILDNNLDLYLETLKEAEKRDYSGWAYNNGLKAKYRFTESKELQHRKKQLKVLEDLTFLGYLDLKEGFLYDEKEEIIRDSYSVYTISPKGKELLKRIKEIIKEEK